MRGSPRAHRGVARGLDGGLDNVVGRGEVGFAGAEADHRTAGGLEGLGLRVHGQGRGRGDGVETIRDTGARSIGHPSMVPRRARVCGGGRTQCARGLPLIYEACAGIKGIVWGVRGSQLDKCMSIH